MCIGSFTTIFTSTMLALWDLVQALHLLLLLLNPDDDKNGEGKGGAGGKKKKARSLLRLVAKKARRVKEVQVVKGKNP